MSKLCYNHHLKELMDTQWYNRKEIELLQEKKLKDLLKNIYNHVPYYHTLLKNSNLSPSDIKNVEYINKIPILKRENLIKNFNDLISKNVRQDALIDYYTSGSSETGKKLKLKREKDIFERGIAAEIRAWTWYGIDHKRESFYFLNGHDQEIIKQSNFKKKLLNFAYQTIRLNPFDMSVENIERYLKKISKIKRRIFYATPSALCRLIRHLEQTNRKLDNIEIVISVDECLLKEQRQYIKDFFNCEIFDLYSSSEVWGISFECQNHNGYHVTSENILMEIVDKENNPLSPGEKGKILLTDLNNYAMPIIRYEIGDMGILSDEVCSCGRGLHLMKPINGQVSMRSNNYVLSSKSKKIFLPKFGFLLEDFSKISNFQITQKNKSRIDLKLVKEKNYSKKDEETLYVKMKEILGDIEIALEYVPNISPLDIVGKHKYINREENLKN